MSSALLEAYDHVRLLRAALDDFGPAIETATVWGQQLAPVLQGGGRLLAVGNGGSAAHAQHLTAELVGRYRDDRGPYSAISLCSETSSLTAIGNDYPPSELFARQVEAHGRPGDVLVAFSTSGHSPNVVAAAERAATVGLRVWALTGPRPNPLADAADEVLAVEAGSTGTVQELHQVALHLLCAAFDRALADSDADATANRVAAGSPT